MKQMRQENLCEIQALLRRLSSIPVCVSERDRQSKESSAEGKGSRPMEKELGLW